MVEMWRAIVEFAHEAFATQSQMSALGSKPDIGIHILNDR